MTAATPTRAAERKSIRVNGTDIHYVEQGSGEPLILLHGGMVSTSELWTHHPFAYVSHMDTLAEHFHVIAPDTRSAGLTASPNGPVSCDDLADDVAGLIKTLGLGRAAICGFSDGGITASIAAIRHPEAIRAIVNHAGYDVFNPDAGIFTMGRMMFGGSPEATEANPDAFAAAFGQSDEMRATLEIIKQDPKGPDGRGDWKQYLANNFDRFTHSPGYAFEDLRKIAAPTLILVGDRDHFCSVEEGATAYRMLQDGEMAVLPNHGHFITPAAVETSIEFLQRRLI